MNKRTVYEWQCRSRSLKLGERTLVMGILNVTPDSFSDGGHFVEPTAAVDHALEMVAQGADIIDIGGESTRPGADPVSAAEEIRRTVPIIAKIRDQSDIALSIDTMKADVAFRFSQRFGDATTAHETGIFRYSATNAEGETKIEFIHLQALLVKKAEGWKILMEYQKSPATAAEWQALAGG